MFGIKEMERLIAEDPTRESIACHAVRCDATNSVFDKVQALELSSAYMVDADDFGNVQYRRKYADVIPVPNGKAVALYLFTSPRSFVAGSLVHSHSFRSQCPPTLYIPALQAPTSSNDRQQIHIAASQSIC